MPRRGTRLSFEEARTRLGERTLRALARTPQILNNWKGRGIPWEVLGPKLLEQISQALAPHSQPASQGVAMHEVLDLQGRVFQLGSLYGTTSKEFRAVADLLHRFTEDVQPAQPVGVRAKVTALARRRKSTK